MSRQHGRGKKLNPVNIENYRYVRNWLERTRLLKEYFGNEIFIRSNCDQEPFFAGQHDAWYPELGLPYGLHICGNTDIILEKMLKTGSDAFELDYKTEIRKIHDLYKNRVTLIGNIDPMSWRMSVIGKLNRVLISQIPNP